MVLSPRTIKKTKKISFHIFIQILLIGIAIAYIFPLIWMITTALKTENEYTLSTSLFPAVPQWHNFIDAIRAIDFFNMVKNSLTITLSATVGTVMSGCLVAYSFAKLKWPGRDVIFIVLIGTLMLPAQLLQVQNFIVFNKLGWIDTYLPMIVPAFLNAGAFNIFLLRQFFKGIPNELSDAARIDGCTELGICFKIVIPLCKPIISSIAVFSFMSGWNDFFNPLMYLLSPSKHTLALGLRQFQQQFGTQWHYMMAISLIAMLPTLILFFSFQKHFVGGLTAGGVKG